MSSVLLHYASVKTSLAPRFLLKIYFFLYRKDTTFWVRNIPQFQWNSRHILQYNVSQFLSWEFPVFCAKKLLHFFLYKNHHVSLWKFTTFSVEILLYFCFEVIKNFVLKFLCNWGWKFTTLWWKITAFCLREWIILFSASNGTEINIIICGAAHVAHFIFKWIAALVR